MFEVRDFDPAGADLALFAGWPGGREGEAGCTPWPGAKIGRIAARVVLEMKSMEAVSPVDELAGLLNELTAEMGEQFRLFRKLRADAEAGLAGEADAPDAARPDAQKSDARRPDAHKPDALKSDARNSDVPRPDTQRPDVQRPDAQRLDGKTARADVKAATDAMSLIVRTLEKIDALQRQLARDRADAEARRAEEDDDAAIRDRLEALIEARAAERARTLFEGWRNGGGDALVDAHRGEAARSGATGPPGEQGRAPGAGGG